MSTNGVLYRTADGAARWQKVQLPASPTYAKFRQVDGLAELFGSGTVVVPARFRDSATRAQHVVVYISTNDGVTWSARPAPPAKDLRKYSWGPFGLPFSAPTAQHWVLFVGQTIYETADAGRASLRVHVRYAPKPPAIWDVDFTSLVNGWAIFGTHTGAALVQTTNGGRDWTPLTPPVPKVPPPPPPPTVCASTCRRP